MTHTEPQKRVVFCPDSVEITYISTGKTIAKGVANHASKAYEFSHFIPYSHLVHSQLPFERGGKKILSTPFAYDKVSIIISQSKAEDSIESVYEIEDEVHSDPDPNPSPTPNPKSKWAQKVFGASGKMTRNPSDIKRKRNQFQKENLALCQASSLPQRDATNSL